MLTAHILFLCELLGRGKGASSWISEASVVPTSKTYPHTPNTANHVATLDCELFKVEKPGGWLRLFTLLSLFLSQNTSCEFCSFDLG